MPQTAQSATHAPVAPRRQQRVVRLDVLRGVAIFAMLAAHAGAPLMPDAPRVLAAITGQLNALASPLFAVVMGMAAQFVSDRTPRDSRMTLLIQQFIRGAVLIALGVWLATWGSWVNIVLAYLGVLLLVGAPLIYLSSRWLIGIGAILFVVSGPLNEALRAWLVPALLNQWGSPLWWIAQWTAVGTSYRLTNLLPMFLLGVIAFRFGMPAGRRVLISLAAIGIVLLPVQVLVGKLIGPEWAVSGGWADTAHDLALVLLTYVVVSALAGIRSQGAARVVAAVFLPFRACGSVALSLYVLQVALIAWWVDQGIGYNGNHLIHWIILVPGLMVAGTLWWRFVGLGPFECLLGFLSGRYRMRGRRA